jgi:hypothetical protein
MAAGGGATVVSGETNSKIKTFHTKPLCFYMLVPNPELKI